MLWELAAERGVTCFGTSAAFICACMKAGIEPARGRDLVAAAEHRLDRLALAPEGFGWVYDHVGARHLALLDERRDRRLHRVRRRLCRRCRCTRASSRRAALGAKVEAFDEDGQRGRRRGRRAGAHRAAAVDAGLLLGRRGRLALPRELLRRCIPASGATATGSRSPRAARAVISGRSDSTINRGGHPHRDERDLPRGVALPEVRRRLVLDLPRAGRAAG